MKDYADRNYLHARIYAMRGRLFSLKDYTAMAKEQALPDASRGVNDYNREKEDVFRSQVKDIISLAGATEEYRPLIVAFLRFYEAGNAKLVFAKAFCKQVFLQWYDIGPYAVLGRGLLEKPLSLHDVETVLEGTYLGDAVKNTSSYERAAIDVDACAARSLYNAAKAFPSETSGVLCEFAARRLASTRMVWRWRLNETYQWSDEKIDTYLKEASHLFGADIVAQEVIAQRVLNSRIDQICRPGATLSVADVEHRLEQDFYSWVSSMFHRDFHSIHCVAAYLWLLFYQIRNIFCIIEARRFDVPHDVLLKRLVCEA